MPMAVWSAGIAAVNVATRHSRKTVDMVDNAKEALPTCPQPQQQ
jgi:putative transposase